MNCQAQLLLTAVWVWAFPQIWSIELNTTSGWVKGQENDTPWGSVVTFQGVPFALAPIGHRRFQRSVPLRNATGNNTFSNSMKTLACPGQGQGQGTLMVDEDCLKLSVYLPLTSVTPTMLPILVIVPGQGESGSYNPSALTAIGGIITIVLNYRQGIFTHVVNEDGTVEDSGAISDILSGLEWVWLNARGFGGNVSAVTIAGVNEGAGLVASVLTTSKFGVGPQNEPMAQQIILHGVRSPITQQPGHNSSAIDRWTALAHQTGCNYWTFTKTLKCLRQMSTEKLFQVMTAMDRTPATNSMLTGKVLEFVELGKFPRNVKLLIGENTGSGSRCNSESRQSLNGQRSKPNDPLTLRDLTYLIQEGLEIYFETDLDQALTQVVVHEYLFPGVTEKSLEETLAHFCSTLFSRTGSEVLARYLSRFLPNVFRYEFGHHSASTVDSPRLLGAATNDELPFLFPFNTTRMTRADLQVFQDFSGTWINFVRKGIPGQSLDVWPQFDEEDKEMMVFTTSGMVLGSSRFLDRDVHFWRDTFPTLRRSYSPCPGHITSGLVPPSSPTHLRTWSSVFLITVILVGILALALVCTLQRYRGQKLFRS